MCVTPPDAKPDIQALHRDEHFSYLGTRQHFQLLPHCRASEIGPSLFQNTDHGLWLWTPYTIYKGSSIEEYTKFHSAPLCMVCGLWPLVRGISTYVSLPRLRFCLPRPSHCPSRSRSWLHPKWWHYWDFSFQLRIWNKDLSFSLHRLFDPCINCPRAIIIITFLRTGFFFWGVGSIKVSPCALRSFNERLRVTVNRIPKGYLPAMTPFEPACLSLVIWGLGRESWECFNGFCSTPEIDPEVAKRNAYFLCSLFLYTWWPSGSLRRTEGMGTRVLCCPHKCDRW